MWKKGITKAGTISAKAFSAILTAIYPGEISTGTKVQKPAEKPATPIANDGNLEALIVAAVQKGASNVSDIYIALNKKYASGILRVTIDKLKNQGMVVEDGNRLVA